MEKEIYKATLKEMSEEKETSKEKIKRHRLLFILTLITTLAYITWRAFVTIPTVYGVASFVCGVILLLAEIIGVYEQLVNYSMLSHYTPPEMPEITDDMYPEVDIFIATHNEDTELLFNTANACTMLDYPDKSKVHIHICDDSDRPEMKQLAADLNVNYWGIGNNKHAKGGNLNNAIRQTSAPIVVTLDADMIPRHEFLMNTVPYFFIPVMKKDKDGKWIRKDENEIDPNDKIGFLQTPQGFYNPDLFQYNLYSEKRIPNEQDMFFKEINVSRTTYNACIYAGSNTLIAREALEKVGYIAIDTITEDILTGLRIQKYGYRCLATSTVLANGQAPINIKTLINQRERWGRGCIDAMKQEPTVFSGRLSLGQKVSYLTCQAYWWTLVGRFFYFLAPVVAILFNFHMVKAEVWQTLVFWLPYYILFNISMRVLTGDSWSAHWSGVVDTVLLPYVAMTIVIEQLGIKQKKFKITEKSVKQTKARASFIFGLPHLLMFLFVLAAIIQIFTKSIRMSMVFNPILLFWLLVTAKNLLFALVFMWGRDNYRLATRFYFNDPVTVESENRKIDATTCDVSETGMAFVMDSPHYISEKENVSVTFSYRGEKCEITGMVVHVIPVNEKWKYCINYGEMDFKTKKTYREYVYDRQHSLPVRLKANSSIIGDINNQIISRMEKNTSSVRKMPRVNLNYNVKTQDGQKGVLLDFNYYFARVNLRNINIFLLSDIKIDIAENVTLELAPAGLEDKTLYKVKNWEELINNEELPEILKRLQQGSQRALEPSVY